MMKALNINKSILRLLKDNGRMSFTEIGEQLGLSRVSIKKRVTKLEEQGIIRGYKAVIHREGAVKMYMEIITVDEDADELEFSVRSNNSLRRAGIHTVGELVEECCAKPDTTSRKQLQRYRNLGRNSADEILIKLFYYQFSILPESRRKEYMRRIAEANR